MRTTIDLELHSYRLAKAIAAQRGVSLGKVLAEAITKQYGSNVPPAAALGKSVAGFTVVSIGRPITEEDVIEAIDE